MMATDPASQRCDWNQLKIKCTAQNNNHIFQIEGFKYEGWNFNSGNYLFTTDTK